MKTLVWAIDPAEIALAPKKEDVNELKAWAHTLGFSVQPIHILTTSEFVPSRRSLDKSAGARVLAKARRAATDYLAALGADFTETPSIMVARSSARVDAVDCLLRFARAQKAEQIAVSSHGRSGAARLVLGSFAELLLERSEIPILFLSHGGKPSGLSSRRVLFATDFSDASKLAFKRMLDLCENGHADLILFHKIGLSPLVEATLAGAGTFTLLPEHYSEEQRSWAEKEASICVQAAKLRGVTVRPLIVDERGETSTLILETARRSGAALIAMASRSGPVETAILGSVARGVFRPRGIPVWVCGPRVTSNGLNSEEQAHASSS